MSITLSGGLRGLLFTLIFLLAACAGAPVQEMSNARQAIQAAQDVEADRYAWDQMIRARALLQSAEQALGTGDYQSARDDARAAKNAAIEAREVSMSERPAAN